MTWGESDPSHTWGCHEQFACETDAELALAWRALTDPACTTTYLMGLAAHSTWAPEATIEFRHATLPLCGRVIRAEEPRRLTYWVAATEGDPASYVSWDVAPRADGGSQVRLRVDEMEGCAVTTAAELRLIWEPIMAALQRLLAAGTST